MFEPRGPDRIPLEPRSQTWSVDPNPVPLGLVTGSLVPEDPAHIPVRDRLGAFMRVSVSLFGLAGGCVALEEVPRSDRRRDGHDRAHDQRRGGKPRAGQAGPASPGAATDERRHQRLDEARHHHGSRTSVVVDTRIPKRFRQSRASQRNSRISGLPRPGRFRRAKTPQSSSSAGRRWRQSLRNPVVTLIKSP